MASDQTWNFSYRGRWYNCIYSCSPSLAPENDRSFDIQTQFLLCLAEAIKNLLAKPCRQLENS